MLITPLISACASAFCSHIKKEKVYFLIFALTFLRILSGAKNNAISLRENSNTSVPEQEISNDSNLTFKINSFDFVGLEIFTPDVLANRLRDFIGIPLSFRDLKRINFKIEEFYKSNDKIVSVKIPPQDITIGKLNVHLTEARVGQILIETNGTSNVSHSKIKSCVESYSPRGKIYDASAMNRGMLLADDLPGVSIKGFLQTGEKEDEVDLVLKTSKEPPFKADLVIDNAHARSLGTYRATLATTLVSPLQLAETIGLQTLKSEGSVYGRFSLGMPLGSRGWRLNLYGSTLSYKVVTEDLAALNIEGDVEEAGCPSAIP